MFVAPTGVQRVGLVQHLGLLPGARAAKMRKSMQTLIVIIIVMVKEEGTQDCVDSVYCDYLLGPCLC